MQYGAKEVFMNQKELLKKLRQRYPDYSLRQWSEQANIQISRMFRIMRGKEMKLNEYIQLKKLLDYSETPKPCFEVQLHDMISKYFHIIPENLASEITSNVHYTLRQYQLFNLDHDYL
jgi:hypothetical protein